MNDGYTYRSGEEWPPPAVPVTPPAPSRPRVGTPGERMAARARRARLDPAWRQRSPESKERLVTLDVTEARAARRRREDR